MWRGRIKMLNYYTMNNFLWSLLLLPVKYQVAVSPQNQKIIQMKESDEEKDLSLVKLLTSQAVMGELKKTLSWLRKTAGYHWCKLLYFKRTHSEPEVLATLFSQYTMLIYCTNKRVLLQCTENLCSTNFYILGDSFLARFRWYFEKQSRKNKINLPISWKLDGRWQEKHLRIRRKSVRT